MNSINGIFTASFIIFNLTISHVNITPSIYGITQLFKLYRMPICSLHSFHTITNFYIIYSVSTLEFATVVLASVTTLLITTVIKIFIMCFKLFFSPLLVSADCTFQINNKKFTEDRFTHLLFESYQKNDLWKWRNTSYMGPTAFFPTLWNPYINARGPILRITRKIRVRKKKHSAVVWTGLGRGGCLRKVGATRRPAL